MWDRAGKSTREAREFAKLHDLDFYPDSTPHLPRSLGAHPFEGQRRRDCVSGQWRGRAVQRFLTSDVTVELVTLAGVLPRLEVTPACFERRIREPWGQVLTTSDAAFDRRWIAVADDADFARAFLTPGVREALLHPAAAGRALVVDGAMLYLWAPGEQQASESRLRFELLSVILSRIEDDLWRRFDAVDLTSPGAHQEVWLPGEQVPEVDQWAVVSLPADGDGFDARADFTGNPATSAVEVFVAAPGEPTFLPQPEKPRENYNSWLVAPEVRA